MSATMSTMGKILRTTEAFRTRTLEFQSDQIPYRLDAVSYRKLFNWLKTELSVTFKPETPWGLPTVLQVEPSSLCNLQCVACPVTEGLERGKQNLDPALFKRLIDEIGDYLNLILLWDWGEPFLNPALPDMIEYAHNKGIRLVCSTNAHVLKSEEKVERLVRSGLDVLICAIDGIDQESYEKYRKGGKLNSVLEGVRRLADAKKRLQSRTPLINLRMVVTRHNEDQLPRLTELCESIGVDVWTAKTLNPYAHDSCASVRDASNELLPVDEAYRRFEYDESGKRIRLQANPCRSLWNCPSIHANGKVCSCTFDVSEANVIGDLNDQSFREIWHGEAIRKLRRQFRDNWEQISLCENCSYAFKGGSCISDTVKTATFLSSWDSARTSSPPARAGRRRPKA